MHELTAGPRSRRCTRRTADGRLCSRKPRGCSIYAVAALSGVVYLTVTANPLGVKVPYQVCWKQPTGKNKTLKKRCVKGTLNGYSWSTDASDMLSINTGAWPAHQVHLVHAGGARPRCCSPSHVAGPRSSVHLL
jgi:hypothetical protein